MKNGRNLNFFSWFVLRSLFPIVLFLLVTGLGLYADLATKHHAFSSLGMPGEYLFPEKPEQQAAYWIWQDVFGFQTSLNEGALFGMGQGRSMMFAVLSVLAFLGILGWVIHSARKSLFLVVTLGMISSGILGNLYDRLGMHGLRWNYATDLHAVGDPVYAVRDWVLVMIGSWPWPNFNIADSMLVCGAALLVLHSFFAPELKPSSRAGETQKTVHPQSEAGLVLERSRPEK